MTTIAVIGLGYVGLPLAVEFGKKHDTLGFDLAADKVAAYARHVDPTGEVSSEDLRAASRLSCSTDPAVIGKADGEQLIKPAAYVVLRDDRQPSAALAEELAQHVKSQLAPYKYPRWIEFIDELPKTATGKIQRFKLRARAM